MTSATKLAAVSAISGNSFLFYSALQLFLANNRFPLYINSEILYLSNEIRNDL